MAFLRKAALLAAALFTFATLSLPARLPLHAAAGVTTGAAAQVTNTAGDRIRYRAGAGLNYDPKGTLGQGDQVWVLEGPVGDGSGHNWYRISIAGRIGWIDARYLGAVAQGGAAGTGGASTTKAAPTLSVGGYAAVANTNGDALRVRSLANGRILAALAPGAVVSVLDGPSNDVSGVPWYRVSGNGIAGWVMSQYLVPRAKPATTRPATAATAKPTVAATPKPTVAATARSGVARGATAASASGSGIVGLALKFVGSRYVWGGTTPAGFDCTGFIYYVFNNAGVKLPRAMMEQIGAGTRVSSSLLQAGDIVYFSNTYRAGISHSGIYIGNGKMVHAGDYDTGVTVSDLWSPYWASHYSGAVRIGG